MHKGDELENTANQFDWMSQELRESYAALKEREERLALVIEGTNDGIWDFNLQTNEVYLSPRGKEMLGYDDSDLRNAIEEWDRLIHPDDVESYRAGLQSYLSGQSKIYQVEFRARHKDGSYRWILARGATFRDVDGKPYRMAGSHTDITERKQADEALRQSERRFSQAFHTSPIPCVILALADGRYLEVNSAWLRLFGFSRDEAIGNTSLGMQIWTNPEDRSDFYHKLESDGSINGEEYLARTRSGEVRTVQLTAEPLELNNQSYLMCFIHDITETRQTQQALEKRVAERTHELATINDISAVVSRSLDLNSILSVALDKAMQTMQMEIGAAYSLQGSDDLENERRLVLTTQEGVSAEFALRVGSLQVVAAALRTAETQQPEVGLIVEYPNPLIRQALELEGVRQYIHVPLVAKGKLVGAFDLGARHEREIKPEELSLLASIGQQIGVAVENGILYNQAEQSAAIAERQRLSRELHDSVTQSLYSVTMYAEAAARLLDKGDSATATTQLRELRDTAQEALREMRLLIFELRPLALEKIGLVAALQARLDSVEARGGVQTQLLVDGDLAPGQIHRMVEEELYNITREALNNALKHSHAGQIRVHLDLSGGEIVLEICDNGAGFTPGTAGSRGGLGLASLQERAQKIGASLHIQSSPGEGAQIRVTVPTGSAKKKPSAPTGETTGA